MEGSARQRWGAPARAPQARRRITPLPVHPGEASPRLAKPPVSPLQHPKPQLASLAGKRSQANPPSTARPGIQQHRRQAHGHLQHSHHNKCGDTGNSEQGEEGEEEGEEEEEEEEEIIEVEPQARHTTYSTLSALTGSNPRGSVTCIQSQRAFNGAEGLKAESSRVQRTPQSHVGVEEEVQSKIQKAGLRASEAPVRLQGTTGGDTELLRGVKEGHAQKEPHLKAGSPHGLRTGKLDDENTHMQDRELDADAGTEDEDEEEAEDEDEEEEEEEDEEDEEESRMLETHRRLEDLGASATEQQVQACIDDLVILEGRQHDAQEHLEDEAMEQVRADVEQELVESHKYQMGSAELAEAVEEELDMLREMWEEKIDRRAQRITQLLELLTCYSPDINLNDVYIHLEEQAVAAAKTRAWKERAHWFGVHAKVDEAKAQPQFPAGAQGGAHAPAGLTQHSSEDFEKPFVLAEEARNSAWKREAEAQTLQRCDKPAGAHGYLVRRIKGLQKGGKRRLAKASEVQSEEPIKWGIFSAKAKPAAASSADGDGPKGTVPADLSADPWHWYRADCPLKAEQLGLKAEVEEIMDVSPEDEEWSFKDSGLSEKQQSSMRKWAHEMDEIVCRKRDPAVREGGLQKKRKRKVEHPAEGDKAPEETGAAGLDAAAEEHGMEQSPEGHGTPGKQAEAKTKTPEKPRLMRQIIEIDDEEGCHRIVHEEVKEPESPPKASPKEDDAADDDDFVEFLRHIPGSTDPGAAQGGADGEQASEPPAAASQGGAVPDPAAPAAKPRGKPKKQVDEAEKGKWQCTICLEGGRVLSPEERQQSDRAAAGADAAPADAAMAEEMELVLHSHPTLKVCVCEACHKQRSRADFSHKGAKEDKCHWCGLLIAPGPEPLPCVSLGASTRTRALACGVRGCAHVFCSKCVRSNLGQVLLADIALSAGPEAEWATSKWACLKCNPTPLKKLQKLCKELLKLRDGPPQSAADGRGPGKRKGRPCGSGKAGAAEPLLPHSETGRADGDGGDDAADADGNLLSNGGRRTRIRRIMDDSEIKDKGFVDQQEAERIRREKLKEWEEDARRRRAQAKRWRKTRIGKGKGKKVIEEESEEEDEEELMYGKVINSVRDADEEPIRINPEISRHLRPHQVEGVRFMWQNCVQKVASVEAGERGLGCILAHCMGLGKTLQVIALVHTVLSRFFNAGRIRTVLVVVPTAVLYNWQEEFRRWVPEPQGPHDIRYGVEVMNETSTEKRWKKLLKWKMEGGVMIIGYHMFSGLCLGTRIADEEMRDQLAGCLQDPGPDLLICDEAHIIKNPVTGATQALKRVRTHRRIALTGSPLQNNLDEYYCMVDFVREGYLGTTKQFKNRFKNPIENGQKADSSPADVKIMRQRSHVLTEQLKGFVQRRAAETVIRDLPSRHVYAVLVRLSPLQRKLYRFYCEHVLPRRKASKGAAAEGLNAAGEPGALSKEGSDKSTNKAAHDVRPSAAAPGGKGSLFKAYAALTKIWTHPRTLAMETPARRTPSDPASQPSAAARRSGAGAEAGGDDGAGENEAEVDEAQAAWEQEMEQDEEDAVEPDLSTKLSRSSSLRDQHGAGVAPESAAQKKGKDGTSQPAPWWATLLDGPIQVPETSASAAASAAAAARSSVTNQGLSRGGGDAQGSEESRMHEYVQESGKMAVVLELLRLAERAGDRVLVFSIHLQALDLLELFLAQGLATSCGTPEERRWKKGLHWFRIDGSTKASERQQIVRTFNDEKASPLARCVLITTGAGGVGLNLVGANRIILMDSHWNPAADLQATFRSWRYGQTKDVFVYRLLAAETMEEKIYNRQVAKEGLSARVVDEQQVGRLFKEADLKELFVAPAAGTPEKPKRPAPADAAPQNAAREQEEGAQSSDDPAAKPEDTVLCRLLEEAHSRWVAKWHEHERLLQEVEEKLSEEEQELAWKAFTVLEDAEEEVAPPETFLGFKYNPGALGFLLIDAIMPDAQTGPSTTSGAGGHASMPASNSNAAPA